MKSVYLSYKVSLVLAGLEPATPYFEFSGLTTGLLLKHLHSNKNHIGLKVSRWYRTFLRVENYYIFCSIMWLWNLLFPVLTKVSNSSLSASITPSSSDRNSTAECSPSWRQPSTPGWGIRPSVSVVANTTGLTQTTLKGKRTLMRICGNSKVF